MKANRKDIMVGNYLKDPLSENEYTMVCWSEFEYVENYHLIPITKEWLIKLGFMQYHDSPEYRFHFDSHIAYDVDDFKICILKNWLDKDFRYVHELQNLIYVLTGQELNIKE